MLSIALALLSAPTLAADDLSPQPYEPEIAMIVAGMLEEAHYEEKVVDDALSRDWFDAWLDGLDYQRMIFLASDVERFRKDRDRLDDKLRSDPPDLALATDMFQLSRKRLSERVDVALGMLDGSLDLTDDESWTPDRHDAGVDWAKDKAELDEVWRQRVENDLIGALLVECGAETPACFTEKRGTVEERLRKRYQTQVKNYADMESTDVLEWYLGALAGVYDPHSTWFAPARNDNFDIDITNSVEGIGARLQVNEGYTTVMEIIPGGPAFTHGVLKKGDKIVAVAQGSDEPVDVVDWRIDKVVKLIRGPSGSEVRLLVRPADKDPSFVREITLVRERVKLEESAASMTMREVDGRKLAIIDVPSFYVPAERGANGVSDDVQELLRQAKRDGAEGVLLDLSMNGGGSLQQAVDMAGLFITAGPVVQIRDRDGRVAPLHDRDTRMVWNGPLVVLTTQASASASEIVAGALQDYGRALVVGAKQTHGKGTVQQVADVSRMMRTNPDPRDPVGGALKLTVQKFYRVSGASTQLKGVVPDVVLPSPFDGLDVLESDLDHALAWDEIPSIPHATAGGFGDVLPELRKRSAARVASSEDFQEIAETLRDLDARRQEQTVSLQLEARRVEFAEAKAEADAEEEPEAEEEGGSDSHTPKAILDEGVRVLSDLVELRS